MDRFDVQPLYRALVENAQDILGVLTPQGVIVTVSPAVRRVLSLSPERLRGRHWIDQVHPDDRAQVRQWLASCTSDEIHRRVIVRAGRPPIWRTLELSGVLVPEDTYTHRIVFSARDATEELAATALLEEREARFRSAFHDAPIGKVMLSSEGTILDSNRAFSSLVDRWSTELEGANFLDLFAKSEGFEALKEAWENAADNKRPEIAISCERQGRPAHFRIMFALVAAKGEAFALAQVQDMTARIEAERALERNLHNLRASNRQLHDMAWMASHDLKEPLRGLVGSLQLILRRHGETLGETERDTAQQAVAQAKALRQRLDEMEAQMTRERSGSSEMLGFGELAEEWMNVHAVEIQQAGLQVKLRELPSFRVDRRIGASFQSLLDQALHESVVAHGGEVLTVQGVWSDSRWRLSVDIPAAPGLQGVTLAEPGGPLFGLRSEIEERGAEFSVEDQGSRLRLSMLVAPD